MSLERFPSDWHVEAPQTTGLLPSRPSDAEFLAIFNKLAVALREAQDDTGLTQGIYFDALRDLPLPAVDMAATMLLKEPGRKWFPTTAEWRTAAEQANHELLRQATVPRADSVPGLVICRECFDTGWMCGPDGEAWTCQGGHAGQCGRRKEHGAHTYTQACGCRETNGNYQRTKHFGAGR